MKSLSCIVLSVAALVGCRDDREPTAATQVMADAVVENPYSLLDLGSLGGDATATVINDAGQIGGVSVTASGDSHAFLWSDGVMLDLGTLGGHQSQAAAINASGQVAGLSLTAAGEVHAFRWTDGGIEDLGPSANGFTPVAINQRGAVSWTGPTPSGPHAMLWEAGKVVDLGALGGSGSHAAGLNDRGDVVGWLDSPAANGKHAFVWTNGVMQDLGTFEGSFSATGSVNDAGTVTGWWSRSGESHAFVWKDGLKTDLGGINGWISSLPVAINARGDVIGQGYRDIFVQNLTRPFLWRNGAIATLAEPDPASNVEWVHAVAINNRGQVAGGYRIIGAQGLPLPAIVWDDDGTVWRLPVPSGTRNVSPSAINDRGDVVGSFWGPDTGTRAALWRRDTPAR